MVDRYTYPMNVTDSEIRNYYSNAFQSRSDQSFNPSGLTNYYQTRYSSFGNRDGDTFVPPGEQYYGGRFSHISTRDSISSTSPGSYYSNSFQQISGQNQISTDISQTYQDIYGNLVSIVSAGNPSVTNDDYYTGIYAQIVNTTAGANGGSGNRTFLDSSAKVAPEDYAVIPLELDSAKRAIENTPLSVLKNQTVKSYYSDLLSTYGKTSPNDYSAIIESEVVSPSSDKDKRAKLGYFRKYLYENELLGNVFTTGKSPGEIRHAYELFVQASNDKLGTTDENNPLNVEMEKFIIPEMIKMMQEAGYKISIKKNGTTTEASGNKSDAQKEYTFDMDNMGWRTQLGDAEFVKYAQEALTKAKNPTTSYSYVKMYQDDVIEQRNKYEDLIKELKGKQTDLGTALGGSNPEDNDTVQKTSAALRLMLSGQLERGDVTSLLNEANSQLGTDNVFKTMILKLMSEGEFNIAGSSGGEKVNINNIFSNGTDGQPLLNNSEVIKVLLERLEKYEK